MRSAASGTEYHEAVVNDADQTPVPGDESEEDLEPVPAAIEALIDGQEEHSRVLGEIARWLAKISKTQEQTLQQVQLIASRLGVTESRVAGVELHLGTAGDTGR